MPDYRYLKKQAKSEETKTQEELEEAERDYYIHEEEAINWFIEFVKEEIKNSVLLYYQVGKNPYISKKPLSREYVFFRDGKQSEKKLCAAIVNKNSLSFCKNYPEINLSQEKWTKVFFPSVCCMNSFEKAINKRLEREDIIVYVQNSHGQMASPISDDVYFINIRAELGKL